MSIMEAITIASPGALPQLSVDIKIPEPGEGQILVKTAYVAINPVDATMASYGLMVQSYPFTPGCDASGIIVALGPNAYNALGKQWQISDRVFGCTRLGVQGYAAWAEYFLFDAALCFPVPVTLSMAEVVGTGVGLLTASLGVFTGLGVEMLDPDNLPEKNGRHEWVLVFGGAGSVGQFAVQLLMLAGFQGYRYGFCEVIQNLGASATIDYNKSPEEIMEEVKFITSGSLYYAFDAVSVNNALLTSIFEALTPTTTMPRHYTTTNDWDPLAEATNTTVKPIQLGPIGRPEAVELNDAVKAIIPVMYRLLERSMIKPSEHTVEGEGIKAIFEAWDVQKSGAKGSTKVVVKVAE